MIAECVIDAFSLMSARRRRAKILAPTAQAPPRGARRANFPGNVSALKSNVTPRVTAGPKRYRPGTLFRGVTLLRW